MFSIKSRKSERVDKMCVKLDDLNFNPGQLIEVIWLDACESRAVHVDNMPNKAFATYKKSAGFFVVLKQDHRYREWHLIFTHESTDENRMDITSIPLSMIKKVRPVDAKQRLTVQKGEKIERVDDNYKIFLRKEVKKFG